MNYKVLGNAVGGILLSVMVVSGVAKLGMLLPDYWLLVALVAWSILIIIAYVGAQRFKETDGEDGMVIYADYFDIFKCLSVIGVPYIVIIVGANFNQVEASTIFAAIYAVIMTTHICYTSAKINKFSDLPVVYLTKFSISILWIFAVIQTLNPSGKNASERRGNRSVAVMILMFLTPVINMFVLSNEGKSLLQEKFKGRRFSGAKNIRSAMK